MTKRILAMFLVVCMVTALVPFTFITASAAPVSSDDAIQIVVDVTNTYSDTYVNGVIGWASSDATQSVEDIYGLSADNSTFQWFYKALFVYDEENNGYIVTKYELPGEGANQYDSWTLGENRFVLMCYSGTTNAGDLQAFQNLEVGDIFTTTATFDQFLNSGSATIYLDQFGEDMIKRTDATIDLNIGWPSTSSYVEPYDQTYFFADGSSQYSVGGFYYDSTTSTSFPGTSLAYWHKVLFVYNEETDTFVVNQIETAGEGNTAYSSWQAGLNNLVVVAYNTAPCYEDLVSLEIGDELTLVGTTFERLQTGSGSPDDVLTGAQLVFDVEEEVTPAYPDVFDIVATNTSLCYDEGETVYLRIKLNPVLLEGGISGVGFTLNYDSEKLTLISDLDEDFDNALDCLKRVPDESWENLSNVKHTVDDEGIATPVNDGVINVVAVTVSTDTADFATDLVELSFEFAFELKEGATGDLVFTVPDESVLAMQNTETGFDKYTGTGFERVIKAHSTSTVADCTTEARCDTCGKLMEAAKGHTPGAEADCENDQVCTVCGEVLNAKLGHDFDDAWTYDETNHWHACANGCDEVSDLAEHTFVGDDCECGYTRGHVHVPGPEADCENDQICTACGEVLKEKLGHSFTNYVSDNNATCTSDGTKTAKCDRCDKTDTVTEEGSALGHDFNTEWKYDETNHWHECANGCGETSDLAEHTYDGDTCECGYERDHVHVPGPEADCENDQICTACGEVLKEKLGHSFTNYVSDNNATCETDGTLTAKCDRCDKTDTIDDEGSALGHSFTNYVSDGNATCESDGTETAKCDRCDVTDTRTDEDSALGHSFTNYVSDNNATCETDGTKTAKCDRCDKTDTIDDEGSALGHSFTNYVSDGNATCLEDGTETAKCDRCDKTNTRTDEDSALGHSFTNYESNGDATCESDGTETAKCDRCDVTETRTEEDSALGHSFTNYVSDNNATCETDGTKTAKCDRCDKTDTIDDEGSALGHSFTNYVSNGDATCTSDGTETAKCDRCDETNTRTEEGSALGHTPGAAATCTTDQVCTVCGEVLAEKLGHTEGEWVTVKEAEVGVAGLREKRCTVCGELLDSEIIPALDAELGDVNGNGEIDAADYISVRRHVMGTYVLQDDMLVRADIDRDGAITFVDYVAIKRHVMGTYVIESK